MNDPKDYNPIEFSGIAAWLPDHVKEKREATWLEKWTYVLVLQSMANRLPMPSQATIQEWIDTGELTPEFYDKYWDRDPAVRQRATAILFASGDDTDESK